MALISQLGAIRPLQKKSMQLDDVTTRVPVKPQAKKNNGEERRLVHILTRGALRSHRRCSTQMWYFSLFSRCFSHVFHVFYELLAFFIAIFSFYQPFCIQTFSVFVIIPYILVCRFKNLKQIDWFCLFLRFSLISKQLENKRRQ